MFTGLVEDVGRIVAVEPDGGALRLTIEGGRGAEGLAIDDSIAVDGCCQTVVDAAPGRFTVVAVEETLRKTIFGDYAPGRRVNLERSLRVGDRLGGHFVLGHVDCVGRVESIDQRESSHMVRIGYPPEYAPLVIPVGSIAINGVSLTVAEVAANAAILSIIPHTWGATTFSELRPGDGVNVEFDMIGKYIRNFVGGGAMV